MNTSTTINFAQNNAAMRAQAIIGSINADITQAAGLDEHPQADKSLGQPGEVFIQSPQSSLQLSYQPASPVNPQPFPKNYSFEAKADLKDQQGNLVTPAGTKSTFTLGEDGKQTYTIESNTPQGQRHAQQAVVDQQNETITLNEWIIA